MPLIKRFNKTRLKLKRFLTQIKIKVNNKGLRLLTLLEKVSYIRIFLTEIAFMLQTL